MCIYIYIYTVLQQHREEGTLQMRTYTWICGMCCHRAVGEVSFSTAKGMDASRNSTDSCGSANTNLTWLLSWSYFAFSAGNPAGNEEICSMVKYWTMKMYWSGAGCLHLPAKLDTSQACVPCQRLVAVNPPICEPSALPQRAVRDRKR